MMFGFGDKGTTNLMTRALAAVGKQLETVPDPTQIHYHLPPGPRHPQVGKRLHRQLHRGTPPLAAAWRCCRGA
jgi:hypothetical protein